MKRPTCWPTEDMEKESKGTLERTAEDVRATMVSVPRGKEEATSHLRQKSKVIRSADEGVPRPRVQSTYYGGKKAKKETTSGFFRQEERIDYRH